jgi:hypothetical protein
MVDKRFISNHQVWEGQVSQDKILITSDTYCQICDRSFLNWSQPKLLAARPGPHYGQRCVTVGFKVQLNYL